MIRGKRVLESGFTFKCVYSRRRGRRQGSGGVVGTNICIFIPEIFHINNIYSAPFMRDNASQRAVQQNVVQWIISRILNKEQYAYIMYQS